MKIDALSVSNFRNLKDIRIGLLPGSVIVGENRAGKSNLIYALRLIFDPTLSYADRQLGPEDFWASDLDGSLARDPMALGEIIEVSVEVSDFADDARIIAALGNALVKEEPLRARLTYRFGPTETGDDDAPKSASYRGRVYGGDNLESPMPTEWRNYLHSVFLHALRDVESDIRNWRRSPLRALLQTASAAMADEDLEAVQEAMQKANETLNELDVIKELSDSIKNRIVNMVGENQAIVTDLAAAPDDPMRLIRGMRIYVDGEAHRNLASASLGTLNVLYLALLQLGLAAKLHDSEIAHVVMGIEEPEAHLHPHLQRLLFRDLLKDQQAARTVLVTTQSPSIASVADPRSLVVLRNADGATSAAAAHRASLTDAEWSDIGRYLDVTRAEMVFARRVLLVEGYAEQTLAPQLAATLGMDLDKLGITVCPISGTHFSSYAKLCDALEIPWAVVTDGDLDATGDSRGAKRAEALLAALNLTVNPIDAGIFVGQRTFEYDLVSANTANTTPCFSVLEELCASPSQAVIRSWGTSVPAYKDYMNMIENAGGKGRFAQRLSSQRVEPPSYFAQAFQYLATM